MPSDSDESPGDGLPDDASKDEKDQGRAEKVKPRKRTKTGCLTCRKRRIKCGEERPICKNCIKSKRECTGYSPPLSHNKNGDSAQAGLPHPAQSYHPASQYSMHNPIRQTFSASFGSLQSQLHNPPQLFNFSPTQAESVPESELGTPSFLSGFGPASAPLSQGAWSSSTSSRGFPIDTNLLPRHSPGAYSATGYLKTDPTVFTTDAAFIDSLGPQDSLRRPLNLHTHENLVTAAPFDESTRTTSPYPALAGSRPFQLPTGPAFRTEKEDITHLKSLYPTSPLLQEECQEVFRHFLDVVAPCMGIFDRRESAQVPATKTTAWTTGLPRMALKHRALAHGIIAIGALHLSRLERSSDDFAVHHFTSALQEIKPLLETKQSRGHVATLATILLLAYFEVITGDHARWSLHISGAARLVLENDYASTLRTVRWMRKRAQLRIASRSLQQPHISHQELISVAGIPPTLLDDRDWDLDQDLISLLMGTYINYDTQIQPNFQPGNTISDLTIQQADEFRILMEMYWWHCKQDLYQSLLSGDAPMLPFSKWKYCPPRGQIGVAESPHATVDHLWLVLARIVDFGFRDRRRKLRTIAANDGVWTPPPGFLVIPSDHAGSQRPLNGSLQADSRPATDFQGSGRLKEPPMANESRARSSKLNGTVQPPYAQPMYGMVPPPSEPVHMSPSFKAIEAELHKRDTTSPAGTSSSSESWDLDADLQKALTEHNSISDAVDAFQATLTEGFQPMLPQPSSSVTSSPFGPLLLYRSPTIAAMWTFFHVARIVLRRIHPHSPPAAMISAGVNAFATADDAQMIGRIFAGIFSQYDALASTGQIDHLYTSAIIECSFSMLFAGVQYTDSIQRAWTVSKLKEIERATGWASSLSAASACEATWSRMGDAGKGPPYQRTLFNSDTGDARGARNHSPLNPTQPEMYNASGILQEHESRFVRHDRSLIGRHASTRAYWALGLLSVEDDLKAMNIGDDG